MLIGVGALKSSVACEIKSLNIKKRVQNQIITVAEYCVGYHLPKISN